MRHLHFIMRGYVQRIDNSLIGAVDVDVLASSVDAAIAHGREVVSRPHFEVVEIVEHDPALQERSHVAYSLVAYNTRRDAEESRVILRLIAASEAEAIASAHLIVARDEYIVTLVAEWTPQLEARPYALVSTGAGMLRAQDMPE